MFAQLSGSSAFEHSCSGMEGAFCSMVCMCSFSLSVAYLGSDVTILQVTTWTCSVMGHGTVPEVSIYGVAGARSTKRLVGLPAICFVATD